MSDHVLIERDDAVTTITINRTEVRNAISDAETIEALIEAMEAADRDIGTRVVILTGAGTAFSSGGNLKSMQSGGGLADDIPAQTRRNYRYGIQKIPLTMEALEVPVIAAVNGPAIGAGCDLTLMCDLRIASTNARFAESFVKVGIVPGDGGAWLLPRVVGFAKACEMALTGDPISAEEALACGLVSQVVEPDALMDAARTLAGRIAANPPHVTRMTKRLLREAGQVSLATLLELSAAKQALGHATADHREAIGAMLEKRPANFTGR